jgi:hypothetical protein
VGGHRAGGLGLRFLIDELPVPELEHEERPERLGQVLGARDVAVEEVAHRVGTEIAAAAGDGIEQRIVGELP